MLIGRVQKSLWSTVQDPGFDGRSLKTVQPWDVRNNKPSGNTVLAVDLVQSSSDDFVIVVYEGSSSRLVMEDPKTPCEAVIVGIIDAMELDVKNH